MEPVALTLADRKLDVVIALAHVLAVLEIIILSNLLTNVLRYQIADYNED